jgi:signal transduction protein with GAF and PtsI domain
MADGTRVVSVRLGPREVELLHARARTVSGSLAGIARELILVGLAGGDGTAISERLLAVERHLAVLVSEVRDNAAAIARTEAAIGDLRSKFDALLTALSSGDGDRS